MTMIIIILASMNMHDVIYSGRITKIWGLWQIRRVVFAVAEQNPFEADSRILKMLWIIPIGLFSSTTFPLLVFVETFSEELRVAFAVYSRCISRLYFLSHDTSYYLCCIHIYMYEIILMLSY